MKEKNKSQKGNSIGVGAALGLAIVLAYKIIFNTSFTIKNCIADLQPLIKECPDVGLMVEFIQNSSRGIVR